MIYKEKSQKKIEILAPAGSYQSFMAAIAAGADAVYAGGPRFGARAFAKNFTIDEMLNAIDYAHLHERKFYLTVNTLLKNNEINDLYDYLKPFYEGGLDAVIVQDLGVLKVIREWFPDLEIHASTQMTITSADGASFIKEQGAARVVPARELSLEEIRDIKEKTELDIECFVHGALCYSYSGQCLMSSLIGGRSGNRGQCAQPCRLPYQVGKEKNHLLSMKDICTLDLIPDLIESGIDSFKIEGRMKQPEYVAGVTSIYRKYVDLYLKTGRKGYHVSNQDKEMLMDLYNRGGFHTGYYKQHNGSEMLASKRPNHAGISAVKLISQKGRELTVQALTELHKGDILEFPVSKEVYTLGRSAKRGEKLMIIAPKGQKYSPGTCFSRTRNQKLVDFLNDNYTNKKIKNKIQGFLRMSAGELATLTVWMNDIYVQAESEMIVDKAAKRPLTQQTIIEKLSKTGDTDFEFEHLEVILDGDVFLPVQQLNELRRRVLEELKDAICSQYHRRAAIFAPVIKNINTPEEFHTEKKGISVLVHTKEQLSVLSGYSQIDRVYLEYDILDIYNENVENLDSVKKLRKSNTEIFLAMPQIFRMDTSERFATNFDEIFAYIDGVLVRNLESLYFLKKHGFDKKIILDHNQYVMNYQSKLFWMDNGIESFTFPLELNKQEIERFGGSAELIIYGYTPVMTSAQCIVKNIYGCKKQPQQITLKDRLQNHFTVCNHCQDCYNVIYNDAPLYLLDLKEDISRLHPVSVRLEFSIENAEETKNILERYFKIIHKNIPVSDMPKHYTRGHFRRGIS